MNINDFAATLSMERKHKKEKTIILAGNPNVGKSTIFNALTGMRQHTGNWTGKTVSGATGYFETQRYSYRITDTPGTYSLIPHSSEEEETRNIICFERADIVVVVCDATCLERTLCLALQIMEVASNVLLCINLKDQAEKRGISIDVRKLSVKLKIPVVEVTARNRTDIQRLVDIIDENINKNRGILDVEYPDDIENAIAAVENIAENRPWNLPVRWFAVKQLESWQSFMDEFKVRFGEKYITDSELHKGVKQAQAELFEKGYSTDKIRNTVAYTFVTLAEKICADTVVNHGTEYSETDRKADSILTGRLTAFPIMIAMLLIILWITITGANIPSQWLSELLFGFEDVLSQLFYKVGAPRWLHGIAVEGMYRVLAWVVSVMLPPMAIFFPLFTLMEDAGYLPRIAYNLDKPFQRCNACGKQALTMCMGFGCNAVGVTGCRVIDSPRERLLAIITNSFVPCNGRFPILISLITMFFVTSQNTTAGSFAAAAALTAVILLGISVTFAVTYILSKTLLKGVPSSFVLELPSYRKPQVASVLVRSAFDRTLFVLGRAVSIAAPAGAVIWFMANTEINDVTLLEMFAQFLDPFAALIGLDGVILMAFILGFPANEIVIPLIIMAYTSQGTMTEMESIGQLHSLFVQNGWTNTTALCTMLFTIMHWPCSTTLLTIKKETGSVKWTLVSAAVPVAAGILCCGAVNLISHLLKFI